MTCPHNFAAWQHDTLAQLATDQYLHILRLKAALRRISTAAAESADDCSKGPQQALAPTAEELK